MRDNETPVLGNELEPRDTGSPQDTLAIAMSHAYAGRYDEGIAQARAAAEEFRAARDTSGIARATIVTANVLNWKGDYRGAVDLVERFVASADDLEPGLEARLLFSLSTGLSGCDRYEEALVFLERAKTVFEMLGDGRGVVECTEHIADARYVLGRQSEAVVAFSDAAAGYRTLGLLAQSRFADLGRTFALTATGDRQAATSALADLVVDAAAPPGLEQAAITHARGRVALLNGDHREAIRGLAAARRAYLRLGHKDRAAVALADAAASMIELKRHASAVAAYEHAMKTLRSCDRPIYAATAQAMKALALTRLGEVDDAEREALAALATFTSFRYRLGDARSREAWIKGPHERALAIALGVAYTSGDQRLVAELIETAKAQALPRPTRVPDAFVRLEPPAIVRVGEISALAGATDDDLHGRKIVDLESAVERVGGTRAIYWGTWVSDLSLCWAIVSAGTSPVAGNISLKEGSPALEALARFDEALPNAVASVSNAMVSVANAPLLRPEAERQVMSTLGAALIPPPLRRLLLAAEAPVSVVVSPAPEISHVPFALLGVTGDGDDTADVRLIEKAVLRLMPPAAVCTRVADDPLSGAPPLAVAIVDPDASLEHPPALPLEPKVQLGCGKTPATREAVTAALAAADKLGVFFFAGHVDAAATGGSNDAALRLAGEEAISARDLFGLSADGIQFPFPKLAFLSACSSVGAGEVEWLGLGIGALAAGASQVVVTQWPTLDHPDTASIESWIISRLCAGEDAAHILRRLQLARLAEWRARPETLNAANEDRAAVLSAGPWLWAPYVTIGIARR